MILDKDKRILIVGLGLLGGSYARALHRQGFYVSAITLDDGSINYALKHNIIDKGTTDIDEDLIACADLVIFAVYPHIFIDWIRQNGHLLREGTIITDVTGVKSSIVNEIQSMLKPGVEFIAAHPMAGREVYGVENSDDAIFKGANYIVVPTEKNTPWAIEICKQLGETLGFADISELSPERHDEMIAFLSQLTHCIAISLMCSNDAPDLARYTGDSFRDLTRIANINDDMWSELFLANQTALLHQMDKYRESFEMLYSYIKSGNREQIRNMMRLSSVRRREFDKKV